MQERTMNTSIKNSNTKDMLIFTIAPVQPFISNSRRTQDLASASKLLSWLCDKAIKEATNSGAEIVFPQIDQIKNGRSNTPNRFVAITKSGEGKELAKNLEIFVRERWENIGLHIGQFLEKHIDGQKIWNSTAIAQINEFLEIYWTILEWDGNEINDSYGENFKILNLGLDARKRLRHFPTGEQPDLKCSLCGIRSALGGKKAEQIWKTLNSSFGSILLRPGERLCAVCSIKRFGSTSRLDALNGIGRFPSTSNIAAASFMNSVLTNWNNCNDAAVAFVKKLAETGEINIPTQSPTKDDSKC